MAEPPLSAAASLVRRFDPALFRTALFAPEPGRERLMTLYAFDVELSRALSVTAEPMIALMRLQFWRDVLEEAGQGAPRAHEIAAPLQALAVERLPPSLLGRLIEAREIEIESAGARFEDWADARFATLIRLAALCLVPAAAPVDAAAAPAGRAIATAFALRTAAPMAAGPQPLLLPGVDANSRAALARGETDPALAALVRERAAAGLAALAEARHRRAGVPAAARPAFLPLGLAAAVLRQAARRPDLAALAARPPGGAVGTLWRALSGRW